MTQATTVAHPLAHLTQPQRRTMLACLSLLDRFAGEGICMGREDADDPAMVLLDLAEAFGNEGWPELLGQLREPAT